MVHTRRVTVARARPRASWVTGEGLDAGAADSEQDQGAGAAPGRELAQVEFVGFSCEAAVTG